MPRPIHVALNFNDRYWALAYTVMRSICLSSRLRGEIVFHLCHGALSADHAQTLDTITSEFGATLAHHDPEANPEFLDVVAHLPETDRFPRIVYTRLLLDRLLPPEVSRILDRFFTVGLPLARAGIISGAVLAFAHTVGEFGVVLMIGGSIPGKTKVLSLAMYDYVDDLQWPQAHVLAAGMVIFSFLVIALTMLLSRRSRRLDA